MRKPNFILERCTDYGQGMAQDYKAALKWYMKAAEQGYASAQNNIGAMYDKAHGVTQDYGLAAKWYLAAVKQGEAVAQYNIGNLYYNGFGVLQDYKKAHMWLNIAASHGIDNASENRNVVESKMSISQIETAQEMAKRCVSSNYKQCDY